MTQSIKRIAIMTVLIMVLTTFAFTAEKPVRLTFATQSINTNRYVYASAFANVFLKGLPKGSAIDISTTSPGGYGSPSRCQRKPRWRYKAPAPKARDYPSP